MKNSHSDTLFHYTKELSSLYSILKEGFRVSYSGEQITSNIFIGIPMISFCDIPVELCEEHRQKYGNYAIGLNKSKLIKAAGEHLSPVHYVIDDWPVLGAYKHHLDYLYAKQTIDRISEKKDDPLKGTIIKAPEGRQYSLSFRGYHNDSDTPQIMNSFNKILNSRNYANYVLGITKNYSCSHKGKTFCAYDECEWRVIIPEDQEINGITAKWYWSKDEFMTWRKNNDNSFLDGYILAFKDDDVDYIIVPNERDKERLEKHLFVIGREALITKIHVCNGR